MPICLADQYIFNCIKVNIGVKRKLKHWQHIEKLINLFWVGKRATIITDSTETSLIITLPNNHLVSKPEIVFEN